MRPAAACSVLVALLCAPGWAVAAGSWIAEANLPDMLRRGETRVTEPLVPRATTPLDGQAITSVQWRYGYDHQARPPLQAWLCSDRRCIPAATPSGRSTAFRGLSINRAFELRLGVPGQGRLAPPLRAGRIQLVVNFE